MIESEEKRKRLTDTITRWCKNTNVLPYLRDYDIPGLVHYILDEFYHITLCCGHMVKDMDEGIDLTFKEYVWKEDAECEISGIYCKDCAEWFKKEAGAWETKDDKINE